MTERRIAIDTESTGLHPYRGDKMTVVSFSDFERDWSIDARAWPADAAAEIRRFAEDPGCQVIMHGSPYDRSVVSTATGIEFADDRVDDTMTGDWLMGEAEDHRLKEGCGARLFGVDAGEEKRHLNALKRGRTQADVYRELRAEVNLLPKADRERAEATRLRARDIADATHKDWGGPNPFSYEDLKAYAEKDTRLTYDIDEYQRYQFSDEGNYSYAAPAQERERRVAGLAYRMTQVGVLVDPTIVAEALAAAEREQADLAAEFEGYSLSSTPQVVKMLYDDWELPCPRFTDAGGRSTDKYALDQLSWDPRVLRLIRHRELVNAIGLFYRPLLEKISDDGRIRSSFNPHRTVTGRWTSQGPNLMQLPKKGIVRKAFIAKPGHVLISGDLPNAELRIAAILCKEPLWLRAFEEDRDLHQDSAEAMFSCSLSCRLDAEAKCPTHRHPAKTSNYQLLYGSGPKNLALFLAMGSGKAPVLKYGKEVHGKFWKAVPAVRNVMNEMERIWIRNGRIPIVGYPGRYRHLHSSRGREPGYKALNAEIQAQVAELVKNWTLELERRAPEIESQLVLQVHDAATLEVPLGNEAAAKRLMQETLDAVNPFHRLPWPVDFKIGL